MSACPWARRPWWSAALLALTACPELPADCQANEYLVTEGGRWRCQAVAPLSPGDVPRCGEGQALTVREGRLACAATSDEVEAGLRAVREQLLAQERQLAARGASSPSRFVGVTRAVSAGRLEHAGAEPGLAAAAARCADEYPGAHLCSLTELYDSVAAGRLRATDRIGKAWLYFSGRNTPLHAPGPAEDGLSDSCAGFTYGADDRGYSGAAVEWTRLQTGAVGFKLHGGSGAPCSQALPLACCGRGGAS